MSHNKNEGAIKYGLRKVGCPLQISKAAGTFLGMQASYYILVSFTLAYGINSSGGGMPARMMLAAVLIGAVAMLPMSVFDAERTARMQVIPINM